MKLFTPIFLVMCVLAKDCHAQIYQKSRDPVSGKIQYIIPQSEANGNSVQASMSLSDIRKARSYLYNQLLRYNAEQSYLILPYFEQHFFRNSTYRNYIITGSPTARFFLGRRSRLTAEISMATAIRILRNNSYSPKYQGPVFYDLSLPVRTPSYRPGLSLHWQLTRKTSDTTEADAFVKFLTTGRREDRYLKTRYITLNFYHHSNGQDGRNDDAAQRDFLRVAANRIMNDDELRQRYGSAIANLDTAKYLRAVNVYNGNFGEELAFQFGWTSNNWKFGKDDYGGPAGERAEFRYDVLRSFYAGIQHVLLQHENVLKPGPQSIYGSTRLVLNYKYIQASKWISPVAISQRQEPSIYERNRLILHFSYAINNIGSHAKSMNLQNRANLDIKYHFGRIGKTTGLIRNAFSSFFVGAGWKGQDDYNLYFEDSFPYLNAGLVFGFKYFKNQDEISSGRIIEGNNDPKNLKVLPIQRPRLRNN